MRSIERTLLAWILGALALGSLVVALVTYLVTLEEMHEVFDADLKNVAQAVSSYHHAGHSAGSTDPIVSPRRTDTPDEYEIVTVTWTPKGERVFSSDSRVQLPFITVEGLSRPLVQGESWIVYSSVGADGVAQAAQRVSARQEMAGESAAQVLPPLIGLVVAVGALLVFGLRRGLQPLDSTAQDVAQRTARSLEPITLKDVPKEVKPLVVSINDLMHRLAVAFATQRRFMADAAHELRTPITALRLQLQLLQRSSDDAERGQAVSELAAGIDRSQRLVEQLLQIARSDPDGELTRREPLDLAELVRTTVAALSVKAEHLGLDLGADAHDTVMLEGDVNQLTVLLNNLVENALRYTPAGGVVDVTAEVEDGRPLLRVVDNGPGIAESEHARVFDRFYRCEAAQSQSGDGSGSGLGLAIVRAIAERHRAEVSLRTPAAGHGLEVRVSFPAP
ncbi:MAG: ATP-binding protein [Roseateles sp.]|uniref:ATP-binding protein n=1 Tax=Roseateles sp. TaxID=1971397 RepID=UPI0040375297